MTVYRIGKTRFANDLTGEGARLNGGRWNNILTPCLYTSQSKALALLEYTVNINIDDIPRALSFTTIDIGDEDMLELTISQLPGDWKDAPARASTKDFGTQLLQQAKYPVIKIASTIIMGEFNFLLNPLHTASKKFKIINVEDFVYDVRIKTK